MTRPTAGVPYPKWPHMTPEQPHAPENQSGSNALKDTLRHIFDSQILNYGDYNLVFAMNERHETKDPSGGRVSKPKYFVIGYRWHPAELMVAPVNVQTLTGGGVPVEINMTNLSHAVQLGGGDYEVGTSTGKTFRFGVQAQAAFSPVPGETLRMDQRDDYPDFQSFMRAFVAMA
ncbi:hypothetical protein [Arthrobacter sp. H5]|uniref:hypothetical protein n=1 Tax=Arthrobacter sp. H5 TaxID=1267973 RepID=UPI0020A6B33B|nr:hypothetical protein [Arthrobacter sp. H5]